MASAAAPASILATISIDRNSRTPLYLQLCTAIQTRAETGSFPKGFKVPPEAEIAELLHLPKNTVRRSLHKLATDGILEGTPESGYRVVADRAPTRKLDSRSPEDHRTNPIAPRALPNDADLAPNIAVPHGPTTKTFSF